METARCHGEESVRTRAKWVGWLLFLLLFALAFRLRQRDFEFLIEPDFDWDKIETWKNFFSTFNPELLVTPRAHVYLDGQFIVYGIADGILRRAVNGIAFARAYFPSDLSFAFGSAILTNIVTYAAGCTIFYAAMFRLTESILISALMAVGLFFAPQMININIGRVDFLIVLPLMIIFYCSCALALGAERKSQAVVLGIATGFAAVIKINGVFLGILPAMAVLATFRFDLVTIKRLARYTAISLAAFALTYLILMGRYFYHLTIPGIADLYAIAMEELRLWAPLMTGPPWYYNVDLMLGNGVAFIVLYLASAATVLLVAIQRRSGPAIFLVLLFIALSVAGVAAPKYSRGGYHLLPVIFALIGFAAAAVQNSATPRFFKVSAIVVGSAVFAFSLLGSFEQYQVVVSQRKSETIGTQLLKREPRDWLRAHVPPGTTICIQTSSQWTLPPMDGFKVIYGPLTMPYLDPVAFPQTYPPSLDEAKKDCPVIVTSDTHRNMYRSLLQRTSAETAAKWDAFFDSLNEGHPPIVFSSPVAVNAKQVYINDLR
jgi:hypothetical protein